MNLDSDLSQTMTPLSKYSGRRVAQALLEVVKPDEEGLIAIQDQIKKNKSPRFFQPRLEGQGAFRTSFIADKAIAVDTFIEEECSLDEYEDDKSEEGYFGYF